MNVAILGASPKPDRYAFKAQKMLMEKGYETFPISLRGDDVLGKTGYQSILDVEAQIHTVTLYVGPDRFAPIMQEVADAKPERIIFNPGTESDEAFRFFEENGIRVVQACTLVLLAGSQFEEA